MLVGSAGSYSLQFGSGVEHSLIENITGIHSLLGQTLTTTINNASFSSTNYSLFTNNEYGRLGDKVLLLKVSDKEYWLLELRLDTSGGILELAFAKVTPQGRAEIPEAGGAGTCRC